MPRCIPSWTSFFDRFFIDCCSQLGPPDPEKSSPPLQPEHDFRKIARPSKHQFLIPCWCQLTSILVPKIWKTINWELELCPQAASYRIAYFDAHSVGKNPVFFRTELPTKFVRKPWNKNTRLVKCTL